MLWLQLRLIDIESLMQIGHLPKGLNPPSLNMLYFSGAHLALAIKTGIITGILSLTVSSPKSQAPL